jgi:hypothetical protein
MVESATNVTLAMVEKAQPDSDPDSKQALVKAYKHKAIKKLQQ